MAYDMQTTAGACPRGDDSVGNGRATCDTRHARRERSRRAERPKRGETGLGRRGSAAAKSRDAWR